MTRRITQLAGAMAAGLLILVSGCARGGPAGGQTFRQIEPNSAAPYAVYVPDGYIAARSPAAPVVMMAVTTPGAVGSELNAFSRRADRDGTLIVAVKVPTTSGAASVDARRASLFAAERTLLDVAERVAAQYHADANRIYLTASGDGSQPAVWAALRNPGVFRAVGTRNTAFDQDVFDAPAVRERVDLHQPAMVLFSSRVANPGGRDLARWLRGLGHRALIESAVPGGGDAGALWNFLRSVPAEYPLVRPSVVLTSPQTRTYDLSFATDRPIEAVLWQLSDGTIERSERMTHTFSQPGRYTGTLVVRPRGSAAVGREFVIDVK